MKASITIHVETLWSNRAGLNIEAELDNPHAETNRKVVSMMFEAARLMAAEARGENERALFGQEAISRRYRELDEREARLEERDKRVTSREDDAAVGDDRGDDREERADVREREQMKAISAHGRNGRGDDAALMNGAGRGARPARAGKSA